MAGEGFRLKKPHEIELMEKSGAILGACLAHVSAMVAPGVTGNDIDAAADEFIRSHDCIPGFVGYQGFPKSICISVNDEVVHGIPSDRPFKDGDLIGLDCGLILKGWWADSGCSVICGEGSPGTKRLLAVTDEALARGIAQAQPGNHIGDIGHAVQSFVESEGFSVVRNYVGHGIGRDMHEAPQVPNYGAKGTLNLIKPGLVIAIEPMVNAGTASVHTLDDDWTVVTDDGKWSCYAEHTIAVTAEGPVILTNRPSVSVGA